MANRIGERIGDYVVTAHLAEGAMSAVYQAEHAQTRASVALKMLRRNLVDDPVAVERFQREYETLELLRDDFIVEVVDFGRTADETPFIVMELLEGATLSTLVGRGASLCPARTIRIVCQLALGLQRAHTDGVVHRDLKPGNVFVCESEQGERARILDFGSVKLQVSMGPKLTALGTTLGSPCYMSPEQAMGRFDVDPRSDLFSLAAILYEMATGEVAFSGETVGEVLAHIIEAEPTPVSAANPDYPMQLDAVIGKGLHKNKAERFSNAIELANAMLEAFRLRADVVHWAHASLDDVECALAPLLSPSSVVSRPELRRSAAERRGFAPRTTFPPK